MAQKEKEATKEKYTIVVPIANPETQRGLLETANAVANQKKEPEILALNILPIPTQVSPRQAKEFEKKRLENQKKMLEHSKDIIAEETPVRTRGIISRSISETILDVVEEEEANELIIGWEGRLSKRDYIFGSKIDLIVRNAPCETTVVKIGPAKFKDIVALVGDGPNAPLAIEKAYQLHKYTELSKLTLLRIQEKKEDKKRQREKGQEIIKKAAEKTSIPEEEYQSKIEVAQNQNIEQALLKQTENYDTVCLGGTRRKPLQRTLFGTLPEKIAHETDDTVLMTKKPFKESFLDKIINRFQKFIR
ncbi:MAG: Nucleotide-binding protein UspA family [Candidatus Methanohalarchaeum thermophilum]|uniref:Nucleotide-binding protein UspA family n=1 Tax=Methanohalarchaeum thermophilum TaxID=1903181 RepID=A0A1Q6DXA5_METT1|nr:MAG: Nucleotide-binding protein UspA family [Candidatus Methanohalarchaeum thermophilum]